MPRKRKAITFSFAPEMAEQVQQAVKEEGCTMSEFLREAISTRRESASKNLRCPLGSTPSSLSRLVPAGFGRRSLWSAKS